MMRSANQQETDSRSGLAMFPRELDDHVKLYGKKADEFEYLDELCETCDNRLDELGWCGHGNVGGD